MFDGSTMLAGIAARTKTIALGLLVGGVTYRNPAQHAKITTTLDVISGGRAIHGLGAAWFEGEHLAYGFEFPPLKERFERLEDALNISRAMFTQERASHDGTRHSAREALNNPKPIRGDIPIMIGGSGEKKTLRMVAQYADESNIGVPNNEVAHKLDVLAEHCERVGRDRSEITVTKILACCVAPTTAEAEADLKAMAEVKGWNDEVVEMAKSVLVYGDADTVGAQLSEIMASGVDGMTISLPASGHNPERVALLGDVALRAIG